MIDDKEIDDDKLKLAHGIIIHVSNTIHQTLDQQTLTPNVGIKLGLPVGSLFGARLGVIVGSSVSNQSFSSSSSSSLVGSIVIIIGYLVGIRLFSIMVGPKLGLNVGGCVSSGGSVDDGLIVGWNHPDCRTMGANVGGKVVYPSVSCSFEYLKCREDVPVPVYCRGWKGEEE